MTDTEIIVAPSGRMVQFGSIEVPPHEVVNEASRLAKPLARVIEQQRLFSEISGKRYVKCEGWTTLGGMLGVLPREVSATRLDDGGYEAVVELVRTSDGQVIGRASAICGMDEKRWGKAEEYARRSMAVTRATGKAYRLGFSWVIQLAGYEPTPFEEMPPQDRAHTPKKRTVRKKVANVAPDPVAEANQQIIDALGDDDAAATYEDERDRLRHEVAEAVRDWSGVEPGWTAEAIRQTAQGALDKNGIDWDGRRSLSVEELEIVEGYVGAHRSEDWSKLFKVEATE